MLPKDKDVKVSAMEKFLEEQLVTGGYKTEAVEKLLNEGKEKPRRVKDRYKDVKSKVKSIRSEEEQLFLGLLEREEMDKGNKLDPGQGYDDTGLVAKDSGKKILAIHTKIQKEIEQQ